MALLAPQHLCSAYPPITNLSTSAAGQAPRFANYGPIRKIPCEILREIFIHCLPHPYLEFDHAMQPDTTVAPMLLCHVCFSWREIVLAYPALWSHLTYYLKIVHTSPSHVWLLKDQLTFLLWWKTNHAAICPFLHLVVEWQGAKSSDREKIPLDSPEATLLSNYFKTAQYFKSDAAYWSLAQRWEELGNQIHLPNLHTIIVKDRWARHDGFYDFETLVQSRSSQTPSVLHRLAIGGGEVPARFLVPDHWSGLTHISMGGVTFSLQFWFSLIRTAPDLQWAYFNIKELTDAGLRQQPTECTLPQLSSLFVHCYQDHPNAELMTLPLSLLFRNLHLPALHTLSLSSYSSLWKEGSEGITELCKVVKSTPAITTITLGDGFLPFGDCCHDVLAGNPVPFWTQVPCLTNLQIELPDASFCEDAEAVDDYDRYIFNSLFKGGWMGLDAPTCPIRRVTLTDGYLWKEAFKNIRSAMMLHVQQYSEKAPTVTFEMTSYSSSLRAAALRLQSEWGSAV